MSEFEKMYTTEEVAAIFQVSVKWVRRQCATGRFPANRIGREYRMRREDVQAALDATRVQPPADPEPQIRINTRHRNPRSYEHLRKRA